MWKPEGGPVGMSEYSTSFVRQALSGPTGDDHAEAVTAVRIMHVCSSQAESVAVRLVGGEGPFLEGCAPPVLAEPEHPQVPPGAGVRAEVVDRDAHHGGSSVDRHHLMGERERLVGSVAEVVPAVVEVEVAVPRLRPASW